MFLDIYKSLQLDNRSLKIHKEQLSTCDRPTSNDSHKTVVIYYIFMHYFGDKSLNYSLAELSTKSIYKNLNLIFIKTVPKRLSQFKMCYTKLTTLALIRGIQG